MLTPGFGYLRITNFRMNTLDDVTEQLSALEKQGDGLKGLIIDLRDNPGGLLDQAIRISDLFIDKGTIVSIKGAHQKEQPGVQGPSEFSGTQLPHCHVDQRRFSVSFRDRCRSP